MLNVTWNLAWLWSSLEDYTAFGLGRETGGAPEWNQAGEGAGTSGAMPWRGEGLGSGFSSVMDDDYTVGGSE